MEKAIELAYNGKGQTAPNPCVGAVLVSNGKIVAKGWHTKYGQPHAEIEAIKDAGQKGISLADCSMFVTLEPCNHFGKTPPCTKAIIKAGIKEVFIGTLDINPDVMGSGAEYLLSNGVKVQTGINESACKELIEDFTVWKEQNRPYCYLKQAATLDGKIATRTGNSAWISCEESRKQVHELRALADAVIVGGNTFFNDNPKLTCRLESSLKQPLAVVVTSRLPDIDDNKYLLKERPSETLFWTSIKNSTTEKADKLRNIGCHVIGISDLRAGFESLFKDFNCHYVLCEGGGGLAMSLVKQSLVDEFRYFIAPLILGDEKAVNVFSGNNILTIKEAYKWRICKTEMSDKDICLTLKRK
ncbi:MAG: bifunctional diaminohydroxyphosphoribosylaminopyrimidine deaminase/5-amino-6-(5-phosphoribosylamino)uracil reductase RibD [Alphaproteobacteria bacterium]|nr:bifunctional diaminohydroxyphosphoribosylaminopyrimidine deaminase/5-amino-6-(5-phosphoribosylamino)uracil reductase RibD [Alphaproteobacteria bacterium]